MRAVPEGMLRRMRLGVLVRSGMAYPVSASHSSWRLCQRVQQRRHSNLPDEIVRHIIDIAGPYCVLVKGGQACSLEIPRTAGRTAKAYLAPVSNNLIRVGVDHESLADAIAAAHDGGC